MTSLHFPCSHPPRESSPRAQLTAAPILGNVQTSRVLLGPTTVLSPLRDLLKLRKSAFPRGAAAEVVPVRGRLMGSSATGVRGWRPRRCRSRRATQQPEAQSESLIPCASLSIGPQNQWRRTRWRAVATRPLGLASRRSLLRAAWVWAPRKLCPRTVRTLRPPQD